MTPNYELALVILFPLRPFRGEGDEAIIGDENVSIADSSGGAAELTAMKSGPLTSEGKDLSSLSGAHIVANPSFQNPLYGTSEFFSGDDDIPEKMMPSPDDFAPPTAPPTAPVTAWPIVGDYEPIPDVLMDDKNEPRYATVLPKRATAKPFAKDEDFDDAFGHDIPEKTIPTLADYTQPNVPLSTLTTALPTDGKYQPSSDVPMDAQNEPQYATVLPLKHRQATAKPFAADEEPDDEILQEV